MLPGASPVPREPTSDSAFFRVIFINATQLQIQERMTGDR